MIDDNIPIRVAVTGVTGRMGREIIQSITTIARKECNRKIVLGAAISRVGSNVCGMDVGIFMNNNVTGIIITDNLYTVKDDFDVLIDFTSPDISMEYLNFCVNNNKNMVIGTTGFSKDNQCFFKDVSRKIGIVYSANFSVGITVMLKVLSIITQAIGNVSDINIIEAHHNKKIDIPSGTALIMKNIIMNALSSVFVNNTRMLHCNSNSDRTLHELFSSYNIPIHSIRAGDLVGEHSVLFTSIGESLQIIHKACSRAIFVKGVLRSVVWLESKVGLFDMCDVLNI